VVDVVAGERKVLNDENDGDGGVLLRLRTNGGGWLTQPCHSFSVHHIHLPSTHAYPFKFLSLVLPFFPRQVRFPSKRNLQRL
jgi:hypothetical protein